jgi:hypothetical protein
VRKVKLDWKNERTEIEAVETKKRMRAFAKNNLETIKSWADSGVVTEFQCITSERDTVCKFCASQNGKRVPIDQAKVGVNIPPFPQCLNYHTTSCCCGLKPSGFTEQ